MIKCVVWDLDNTVWRGVLLEDGDVTLRPGVRDTIVALDERGVLHSIASRNEPGPALAKLAELGLAEYFLVPQIGWHTKSHSIKEIAHALNIGLDAIAFVDDEPYERDEVAFALPEVSCVDSADIATLLDRPEFIQAHVTPEARGRRQLYVADQSRRAAEDEFAGPAEEFLASLDMRFTIRRALPDDLLRAEELTVRTNQLNTTGRTYSRDELDALRRSEDHLVLVAELEDRFGPYGTIGLAVVERAAETWTINLLLMSCRVMSRGVGVVLISHVRRLAARAGARLVSEFVPTGRNRMMYATYRFTGFTEIERVDGHVLLESDPASIPADPPYVRVLTDD